MQPLHTAAVGIYLDSSNSSCCIQGCGHCKQQCGRAHQFAALFGIVAVLAPSQGGMCRCCGQARWCALSRQLVSTSVALALCVTGTVCNGVHSLAASCCGQQASTVCACKAVMRWVVAAIITIWMILLLCCCPLLAGDGFLAAGGGAPPAVGCWKKWRLDCTSSTP